MAEDSRARILALAVSAIDTGGEAAIRVNHLAAEAGVTPPVIYYHFGSRDGLVIAAQIERYARRPVNDIVWITQAVDACTSSDDLREVLVSTWKRIFADRGDSRWRRISALGSAWARPELAAAIAAAQDDLIVELVEVLEPCRERGWLRPGIDLVSAIAWQHSVVLGRVFVERGEQMSDVDEWDRLTLESLVRAFFGS